MTEQVGPHEWVAVDWGTSNVRAWGIGADGEIAWAQTSDRGMSRLSPGDYPGVLADLLTPVAGDRVGPVEVLVCGMAGARQGWYEAPYLEAPAALGGLLAASVRPDAGGLQADVRILPGICQKRPGEEDVMRGEETQLLGLLALRPGFSGTVCMPGTHSKWVRIEDNRIAGFETAMTGELYEAVGSHTVVRHALSGEQMGPATEDGIEAGLTAGLAEPERLSSLLFRTRAAALLSGRGPDWCFGYLSGLLVGAEVAAHRQWLGDKPVPLIGSPRLCRLYGAAVAKAGGHTETLDATEATIAGLKAARNQEIA
ncbi:MAG TPA: 2-dehydro-3-deoxygalactonokinase [Devosiaceae bacterium]|jgi:2-dehydro-3-deoxygalactonokinase|nr:2-dehydro-3-deoxygalactonokinase [Devosiaceae bacterium]